MTALDDAWQAALAAEHRAVFGYALLGPKLSGSDRELAVGCAAAHEDVRDETELALAAAGLTPVGPEADYPLLYPVANAAAARVLAAGLENFAAASWRFVYATAVDSSAPRAATVRTTALRQLTASTVRGVRWRVLVDPSKATTPFPGIEP